MRGTHVPRSVPSRPGSSERDLARKWIAAAEVRGREHCKWQPILRGDIRGVWMSGPGAEYSDTDDAQWGSPGRDASETEVTDTRLQP